MLRHPRNLGLVVIVAVVIWGGLAQAQPGGGGRGGRGGPGTGGPGMGGVVMLAGNPVVQKEIELEGEEAAKVQEIVASFREEMQSAMEEAGLVFGGGPGQLQGLSPEERQTKMREMNEKRAGIMKKLNEKFVPQLKESLSAPQAERLQQINWQMTGSQALAGPELAKSLELTKEQQDKITGINQEFAKKQQELPGGFGRGGGAGGATPDPEAMRERMQKVQALAKERDAKAIEVLSSEQQKKYTELKGKPFDLAQLQGGFGGRGGPGGGRPGAAGRPQKKAD